MRRLPVASAALLLAVLALAGCVGSWSPGPVATSVPTGETVPPALEPYYHQLLEWEACGPGLQCATATAPLDWDDPAAASIELSLARRPATGQRLGSLLVDPGGPGGSGVDFVGAGPTVATTARLNQRYDVVGIDPRGVRGSTEVVCAADDAARDRYAYGIVPGERGGAEWLAGYAEKQAAWAAGCLERTGELLGHVDTVSAARDLDLLRAVLGDERLNYLGYSYGTFLGASYAELYPERVGRLVLDGGIDPSLSLTEVVVGQAVGFESAYRAWLRSCLGQADCPFGGTVEEAMQRTARILAAVDTSPLRGADGRLLGLDTLYSALIVPLYDPANWGYLTQLLTEVQQGQTATAFLLADSLSGRLRDGSYATNQLEAALAVNCLDFPADASPEGLRAEAERLAAEAPVFGPVMAYGALACAAWPVGPPAERGPIVAPGSPDILVIGTTGDPATPYAWSEALAAQLERGHLIGYEGEGHTAYARASACVDDAVDAFLIDGALPEEGLVC